MHHKVRWLRCELARDEVADLVGRMLEGMALPYALSGMDERSPCTRPWTSAPTW